MTYCSQYTLPHGIKSRRELSQFGPRRQHWLNSPITATPKSKEVVRETRKSWGLAVRANHVLIEPDDQASKPRLCRLLECDQAPVGTRVDSDWQILRIERRELTMETLGMNLTEGKALLSRVQDFVVTQQAGEELEQRRACPHCARRYTSKDSGSTVFGPS